MAVKKEEALSVSESIIPNEPAPADISVEEAPAVQEPPVSEPEEKKPKRAARKKKAETAEKEILKEDTDNADEEKSETDDGNSEAGAAANEDKGQIPPDELQHQEDQPSKNTENVYQEGPVPPEDTAGKPQAAKKRKLPVLTIDSSGSVDTPDTQEEAAWHEIRNAYRTRRILTGVLGGIETMENGKTIVVVSYNDFRVIIPLREMMVTLSNAGREADNILRQRKIVGNMLGAEIDFVIKGIESKSRSIVASRKDAMLRKQRSFYLTPSPGGEYRVSEGQVVQARVIAVAEKVIRIEAFGAECSIVARDLSWDWLGDAAEYYSVGDKVLIRMNRIVRDEPGNLSIRADIKSVTENTVLENLQKCKVQGKYVGKVTDIYKGVVYIRLSNGVNAVAHSCYDRRTPGKKDEVSFVVTHIDEERGVAVGIITRIIKRIL